MDEGGLADEVGHPRRRVGEQVRKQVRAGAQVATAVQGSPRKGEVGEAGGGKGHDVQGYGGHTAYGGPVERTPSFLAALASAAVPDLHPVSVDALPSTPEQSFDVGFVEDDQHRRWVVRAPRTAAAGARMDLTVALLGLLARRLPFAVPAPKGFVELKEGGRAAVYPYLPGRQLDFAGLPAGPGISAELGRAIAALHNTDIALFDEAGVPSYDADDYRTRRLADLDRAAQTGRVPAALLGRWERALEDVSLWRFAPTPVHGDLTGDQVLAVFEDEEDSSTGRIRAVTGWEDAKVADPADDFAALVTGASPQALETVLEAYAHTRVERPDRHLLIRARLASELGVLGRLMEALAEGRTATAEALTTDLHRLDAAVHDSDAVHDDYRRTSLDPPSPATRAAPPPITLDDEDDDLPEDPDLGPDEPAAASEEPVAMTTEHSDTTEAGPVETEPGPEHDAQPEPASEEPVAMTTEHSDTTEAGPVETEQVSWEPPPELR